MKPHTILHIVSSIDGRIVTTTWPKDIMTPLHAAYEQIHESMNGDAWIVGRVTMQDFAKGEPRPEKTAETFERKTWKAPSAGEGPYAFALDAKASLHLNRSDAGGDPIVVILTEAVSDDHLAELRRDGISYIFAGAAELDLGLALELIGGEFGVERLLIEGGGGINGSFLAAGLIDEISLLLAPIADGGTGTPTTFDRAPDLATGLKLVSVAQLDHDIIHLRYTSA